MKTREETLLDAEYMVFHIKERMETSTHPRTKKAWLNKLIVAEDNVVKLKLELAQSNERIFALGRFMLSQIKH
jgi:hypothetical protein